MPNLVVSTLVFALTLAAPEFRAPKDVSVEFATAESLLTDPRSLCFLDDGTPLVLDRVAGPKLVLKALSSTKDGKVWDKATIVLESENLSDAVPYGNWLIVVANGEVRRVKPTRAGEPADSATVLVQGLAGPPEYRKLTVGPDGWLYITAGVGDHDARGSDGSRARVLGTGAVFRCRPDGSRLETFAVGLQKPGRISFDAAGRAFVADGKLIPLAEAGDYSRLPAGKLAAADVLATGKGLLVPDATLRSVLLFEVVPIGASLKLGEPSTYLEAPKDKAFAPVSLCFGPDQAVYVVGRRILRLSQMRTAPRPMTSWSRFASMKDEELLSAASDDDRERVRRELVNRGGKNRDALIRLLDSEDATPAARLMALGALQAMVNDDVLAAWVRTLANSDADSQRLAAELLGQHAKKGDAAAHDALVKALSQEDRAVSRSAAQALARLGNDGAADALASALSFDDGKDVVLRDGLARALERLGKPGIDALLTMANSGVQKDSDRVLEVFLTCRTRPALDAVVPLLQNPHLNESQRADLVRSCGEYRLDPPASLDAVVAHVSGHRKDSPAIVRAMLNALASSAVKHTANGETFARSALTDGPDDTRRAAVRVLARTPEGARHAGRLFLDGKLPAPLRKDVVEALKRHAADEAATKLLAEVQKSER